MRSSSRYFIEGVTCRFDGRALPVANLSVGGLFAATELPPPRGQVVGLELDLGGIESFPIVALVTWVNAGDRPTAPTLPRGFGVRITRIGLPAKLAIVNTLKRAEGGGRQTRP
jgi:hypothetical protein